MHHKNDLNVIVNGIVPRFLSDLNDLIRINRQEPYDRKWHEWTRIIADGNIIFICIDNDSRIVGTATVYRKTPNIAVICDLATLSSQKNTILIETMLSEAAHKYCGQSTHVHTPLFGRCAYEDLSNIAHIGSFVCSLDRGALWDCLDQCINALIMSAPCDHKNVRDSLRMIEDVISQKISTPQIERMRRFIFTLMEASVLMRSTSCA